MLPVCTVFVSRAQSGILVFFTKNADYFTMKDMKSIKRFNHKLMQILDTKFAEDTESLTG